MRETRFADVVVRWLYLRNAFESQLYGLPIWEFHIDADYDGPGSSRPKFLTRLRGHLRAGIMTPLEAVPWNPGYTCSKVVPGEPLHRALKQAGFEEVEQRRLYRTPVREMVDRPESPCDAGLRFTTLATLPEGDRGLHRARILSICGEAFASEGFSRHFTDPLLLERRSGLEYILAVMHLNFERLRPADFAVALDDATGRIEGFSVVGQKPGLTDAIHTQLLSAVANAYRGRGIYEGLTRVLLRTLPRDAMLLNVTHIGNSPMQRAYRLSGRTHLADTVLMRRIFR
jgi:hypothetical protein